MANEYAQFAGRPGAIELGDIFSKAITGAGEIRAARQAEREALDKQASEAQTKLEEYQPGLSKSFNQLVMQGADQGRNRILELNRMLKAGQITPSDYKMGVSAVSDSWKNFSQFTKSYNGILEEQTKAANSGNQSALANYNMNKYANLANFSNLDFTVGTDNKIRMVDGNTGGVIDFQAALMPDNFNPPKVDVIKETEGFTKSLGTYMIQNGIYDVASANQNPAFKASKQAYIESMLKDPYSAGSILADFMQGYDFYETDKQLQEISDKKKAIKLVPNQMGLLVPELTEDQKKEARNILNNVIDSQIDLKTNLSKEAILNIQGKQRVAEAYAKASAKSGSGEEEYSGDREQELINAIADPNYANARFKGLKINTSKGTGQFIRMDRTPTKGTGGSKDPNVDVQFQPVDASSGLPLGPPKNVNLRSSQMYTIFNEALNNKISSKKKVQMQEMKKIESANKAGTIVEIEQLQSTSTTKKKLPGQ